MAGDKKQLRKEISARLEAMSAKRRGSESEQLVRQLIDLPAFRQAAVLYGYYPMKTEVDLRPLLEAALAAGKIVALPRIEKKDNEKPLMHFYRITSLADVRSGFYGIQEPIGNEPVTAAGLMLVPGLAFTEDGRRLGHGGGFYDRYLAKHHEMETVAAMFSAQLVEELPTEAHDILINRILVGGKSDDCQRDR
ncbi:MAG: 5-formyltetrahydrofolate cyclo-ligase [Eubacteriales bacterium]|nr:5-formyltetrahydrofolate cyclo-ligase [Eubacteriales bacterium]